MSYFDQIIGEKMQNSEKKCDLHTHTRHSDGTYTPRELIKSAKGAGLSAIALTDHNTVSGLSEFVTVAKELDIEAVPGVEFSVEYGKHELHLIGMFIRPEHYASVVGFIGDVTERKNAANRALIKNLASIGFDIDYDALISATPDGYVNRAHIAAEMVKKGYTKDFNEAFENYLSERSGYYKPPKNPDLFDTLDFIGSIGAVSVLAHPLLQLDREELRALLPTAIEHGLCAIETLYAKYDRETREFSSSLAAEFSILESGGSDFHGDNKPNQRLGVGMGDLAVPYSIYEKLKERSLDLIK